MGIHVDFIDIETASVAAGNQIIITRPGDEDEKALVNGDMLKVDLWVGDAGVESPTWTLPAEWTQFYIKQNGTLVYVGAYHFITDIDNEPASYTFTYNATPRALIGGVTAYRGVLRDLAYDPVTYPYGWFAPHAPAAITFNGGSSTLMSSSGPITGRAYSRVSISFGLAHGASAPILDDVSQLIPIRARVSIAKLAVCFADEEYVVSGGITPARSVQSSLSGSWLVIAETIEPIVDVAESFDNYKSKIIRSLFPAPYDTSLGNDLGKLLACIGTIDNEIGGLFGDNDFLPDDPDGTL